MKSENNYCQLVVVVFPEERSGEGNQGNKKEKDSVDIYQVSVDIFRVD
jgi:hypothetical protein